MKTSARITLVALAVAAAIGLAWWVGSGGARPPIRSHRDAAAPRRADQGTMLPSARLGRWARLRAEIGPDAISPIAADLNAPGASAQRDLEILNAVFEAWRTNFPGRGNPVGENDEITAALAGDNAERFAFVSPRHRAINDAGQLCDRWGNPYRFHQLSGTAMEIWSAGPDGRFATADDVRFTPASAVPIVR